MYFQVERKTNNSTNVFSVAYLNDVFITARDVHGAQVVVCKVFETFARHEDLVKRDVGKYIWFSQRVHELGEL